MRFTKFVMLLVMAIGLAGCGGEKKEVPKDDGKSGTATPAEAKALPVFTMDPSEYPSWSVFMVAGKTGMVNPLEGGHYGELETKWGVDIVINPKDYPACLTSYAEMTCDAVCITNIDALNPALKRSSTAICATSTSNGADKIIAVGFDKLEDLKGVEVFGAQDCVSEYVYYKLVQSKGLDPNDFPFASYDPAAAALGLRKDKDDTKSKIQAISVWNPFAMSTLRNNTNAKLLGDSADSALKLNVIDMVVIGNDVLAKPKGPEFACLCCDIFYSVCKMKNDKSTADITLEAIGKDFSNLPLEDMKIVCQETAFFDTPKDGIALFSDKDFQTFMQSELLVDAKTIGAVPDGNPTVGFGDATKSLNFDTQYMKRASEGK